MRRIIKRREFNFFMIIISYILRFFIFFGQKNSTIAIECKVFKEERTHTVGSRECFTSKFYGKVGDEAVTGLVRDIFSSSSSFFIFFYIPIETFINQYRLLCFACQSKSLDKIKDVERFHDLK